MRGPHIATLFLVLASAGLCCSPNRARFAPPEGSPEPPDGEGWFCSHATTPHQVSWCKREREACDKQRAGMIKEKLEFDEVSAPAPDPSGMRPGSARVAGPGGGDDEALGDEPEPAGEKLPDSSTLWDICSIDPGACSSVSHHRRSVPTYSSCVARPSAFCSAYYHEFNYYRRDKENEWRHFCAETRADCDTWRALWHLHVVKRPCERVP